MPDQRSTDAEIMRAMLVIIAVVGLPIAAVALIAWISATLGAWLWAILIVALAGGALYLIYRFKISAPNVRVEHERELLARLAQAERQQRGLPRAIAPDELQQALTARGMGVDSKALAEFSAIANRLFDLEFLSAFPSMPGIPVEAERVYDIDYDRRTLRKGEDPPYRLRTDARGRPTTQELEAFEAWLHGYLASTTNPEATRTLFVATYADLVAGLLAGQSASSRGTASFTVPLIDLIPDGKAAIAAVIAATFERRVRQWHHFSSVRAVYERNRARASEATLRVRDLKAGAVLDPANYPGPAREALDTYLAGSPLHELFLVGLPFALPAEKRFEGQFMVARQGSGKTNALECLIFDDLAEVAAGRASLVVMDSQGLSKDALLGRLAKLRYFQRGGPLENKLIYLEPDIDWPLALNIFDIGQRDFAAMRAREREATIGSACEVIEFLFTGLLGGELSDNMTMLYRYLVPAMLAIPDADMNTFIELLDTGWRGGLPAWVGKYRQALSGLDPDIRGFLETDYLHDVELVKTKAAVRRRLRAALADTNFRRMFTQPRNKLDLFSELQAGKVILVNTFAAGNYVEPFGRLILALLMQATHRRLELDREQRLATFVYLDERQDYIAREERIARYIDKCRKQNVALVLATQRLGTIESPRVLNALKGTPIKFAGSSDADADELANLLDSTAEHIRGLPRGRFSAQVSGVTPHAIDISFPRSPLEALPRLSEAEFDSVRAEMRSRYAVRHEQPAAAPYAEFSETRPKTTPSLPAPAHAASNDDYDPFDGS